MDDTTRGYIEKTIDRILEREILNKVEWIEEEVPISSLRDVALGYTVLSIEAFAEGTLIANNPREHISEKDEKEIKAMIKRRLPEIVEKIETELGR